ncbi:hypothetical protein GVX82_02295 [Patescibacteria group bacterium]|jgi:hypothetical protein|nr:hypothetical protein [Patescibacteria group bacterium]
MFLRTAVLLAALLQIPAAALLSIGTFEESTRTLPTLIQPAGWAFGIWGLIYLLSIVYATYQAIPRFDHPALAATRTPALAAFLGSTVWLWLAGQEDTLLVWGTIPVLFIMAHALSRVVRAAPYARAWLSHIPLLPYAAWTGIAQWLNVQALLNEYEVVQSAALNLASNLLFLLALATYSLYWLRASHFSPWYGGVIVWAATGVVAANLASESGSMFVALAAGALGVTALVLTMRHKLRTSY